MDAVTGLLVVALLGLGILLWRRERDAFRLAQSGGNDLFLYSRRRYLRRRIGVGVLFATAITLAAIEVVPHRSPTAALVWMALLTAEVLALLGLPLYDLWETARTARPEDLTRQGDPDRRTRNSQHPPP